MVDEVSRETGASARGLRAIMNALVGLELLTKTRREICAHAGEREFSCSQQTRYARRFLQHEPAAPDSALDEAG